MFANSGRAAANAFTGREHELSSLRTTMRANRLTSLVGRSTTDVRIVELAALTDQNALLDFVAATLGVRERPGECALSAMVTRADTQSFVLDNCEPLARPGSPGLLTAFASSTAGGG